MGGRFRDYEHVLRLVAIFLFGVAMFLLVRWWLVPADFGVYGHFRAGALDENRDRPMVYAGADACADCHADVVEVRADGSHAAIGCEACHGPLAGHAAGEDEKPPPLPDARLSCIRCHDARAGKPAAFPQVDVADHAPDGLCSACHEPHRPGIP